MSTLYVDITDRTKQQLRVLCAHTRRTQAEHVQEALDRYLATVGTTDPASSSDDGDGALASGGR